MCGSRGLVGGATEKHRLEKNGVLPDRSSATGAERLSRPRSPTSATCPRHRHRATRAADDPDIRSVRRNATRLKAFEHKTEQCVVGAKIVQFSVRNILERKKLSFPIRSPAHFPARRRLGTQLCTLLVTSTPIISFPKTIDPERSSDRDSSDILIQDVPSLRSGRRSCKNLLQVTFWIQRQTGTGGTGTGTATGGGYIPNGGYG
ncbi:hypothetical protein B0H13DRAFT_2342266 [Mycena leptocephala]|nr:hypothetical protein B0H13DRAFT_2342266 [Mycena leptocephala]